MGILYNKVFTGEIPPVVVNSDSDFLTSTTTQYNEISIIKWREIALKHLPTNANLATTEFEFKLEYLHTDYLIPSRVIVPSSAIPNMERRETNLQKQVKTLEFKNKYNTIGNYAFELRLIKHYDPNYTLGINNPFWNEIDYNVGMNYPISELIYNNRLPGFMDLISYLIKNGTLIFADIKQELKVQILPKLSLNDIMIFGGGYSGSVTFELLPSGTTVSYSDTINLINQTPTQVLSNNQSRYGFYLTNNSNNNIYYNFSSLSSNSAKLILKPGDTLVQENGKLSLNNSEIDPGDSRYLLGLPLWCMGTAQSTQQISIEEISYI